MMELSRSLELLDSLAELLQQQSAAKLKLMQMRQILEQSYKELTADSGRSFGGLFARMQYYHDTFGVPEAIVHQVNSLRILCNRAAHDEIKQIPEATMSSAALTIYTLFKYLHKDLQHQELDRLLKNALPFARRQAAKKNSFHAVLKDWGFQENGGKRKVLELKVIDDEGQDLIVILRDSISVSNAVKYSELAPNLWHYSNLYCHNLSEVAGKVNNYIDNPGTLIVLEPDFLVDATGIAQCLDVNKSNPEIYILSKLFSEGSSSKMLLGQMANSMFDSLIQQPQQEYGELFKEALASASIPMVALGAAAALSIHNDIQEGHLPQLQHFAQAMQEHELLLEPSYLCPLYGLQGRLDLLYKDKKKFSIVELKSGKPHPYEAWQQHIYQVVAYNMIIRSAYGAANLGTSSIFYSGASENILRHIANLPLWEQQLMHTRNRIVGIMQLLCREPARFFDWLFQQSEANYSPFIADKLSRFKRLRKSLRDYEYEWFIEQIRRIAREIRQVKLGGDGAYEDSSYGHNALWQLSAKEKEGKIIGDLEYLESDGRYFRFKLPRNLDNTDFRAGDIVILYDQNRKIDQQEIIRGVIESLDSAQICVRIRAGVRNSQKFAAQTLWAVEHDLLETFLYSPISSLISFLESSESKRDLLLGLRKPETKTADADDDSLDAILSRMQQAEELHIVQGPPGTGKTSGLLTRYIQSIYHETDKRMLILSFTNRAVDEICLSLKRQGIPFIRTGSSQAIEASLLENVIKDKRYRDMDSIIRSNRIFISTVQSANAYFRDLCGISPIDEIVVDEASQILEAGLLGILSAAGKCILIGDQNQLPAISTQAPLPYSFKAPDLQELGYGSHNQSLMERLFKLYTQKDWAAHRDMLFVHYRMHEEIAALVKPYYQDKLRSAKDEQRQPLPASSEPDWLHQRLLWIECPISDYSFHDPRQVQLIKSLIAEYEAAGLTKDKALALGIVAPYRAMIHALKQEIAEYTIDTVERFQGSERDIIILCLPFKNESSLKHIQALSDDGKVDRKLNVAVSRAKERLVIIGNSILMRRARHYAALYEYIRQHAKIINYTEIGENHGKSPSESAKYQTR